MGLETDRTFQLLRTFARRRRRLILLRGLAATTLVLIAAMFIVALLDRFVVMQTPVRVGLSLAAYAAAVAVAWLTAGRHLVRRDDPGNIARMIESAEPVLRDRLLAAIELGHWANGAAAFRQIVREDANRRAAQVRVERTLPWRLISWWMAAGAGAIAVCVILLSVPNLQFGRMLGRALLPTAEIRRASRYTVAITGEASRLVPAGEASDFEVAVMGGQPRGVKLEVKQGLQGPARVVPMEAAGPAGGDALLYRATVTFDAPATLRAWADDADSLPVSVDVRPRPNVISFTKSYSPPTYLLNHAKPTPAVTEETGALEALHGSSAQLELLADQSIRSGQIELLGNDGEPLAGTKPIELTLSTASGPQEGGANRLSATIPIQFDGAYRVQLIAQETGFETRHAPIWPVKAILDLPPLVQAESVEGRPVSSDALLGLRAMVTDDVGLAWIRKDIRVSGGDWQEGTLDEPGDAPRQMNWSAPLDLLPLELSAGDRVEARLVVSDLKGGESVGSFGEWIIVADGVEDSRLQTLAAKQEMSLAATRLADAITQLQQEIDQGIKRVDELSKAGGGDSIELDQLWLSLAGRARAAEAAADDTHNAAVAGIGRMSVGRDARDIERIGEAAAVAGRQVSLIAALTQRNTEPSAQRLAQSQDLGASASQLASAASTLAQTLVHTEQAALAARELRLTLNESTEQLSRIEAQLGGTPQQQALALQQLSRGAATTAARLQGARERLDEVRSALASDRDALARIDEIRTTADRLSERLRRAVRAQSGEALIDPVTRVRDAMESSLPHVGEVAVALEQRLERDRRRLEVPPTAAALDALASAVPGGDPPWDEAITSLGDRARLHERRVELDAAFLSDLTLAQRAVRSMAVADEQLEDPAIVSRRSVEVAAAMHTLETGHELSEIRLRVSAMHEAERTEPDRWSLDRWRDWLSLSAELSPAATQLARTGHAREAVRAVSDFVEGRSAQTYARALEQPNDPAARRQALAALAGMVEELKAAEDAIAPAMREARAILAKEAMSLADWMEDLASQAQALSQRTRTAGNPAEAQRDQQEFEDRVSELEEAIRRDAAQQDLLSEPGRQRSRDADDALAMLRQDRSQRTDQMQAAQAAPEQKRAEAMSRAADVQQESAQTLSDLAEHYRNLESGPEAAMSSREGLREHEDDLGIRQRLDTEYERMEKLAAMENLDDAEMLKALEEELKNDEAMQRELGRLADEAAREGQQQLDSAAQGERQVQEQLEEAARDESLQGRAEAMRAQRLAEQAREIARNDLPKLGERLDQSPAQKPAAKHQLQEAQQAVDNAADEALKSNIGKAAQSLQSAKEALKQIEQSQRQQWEKSATEMYEAAQKAGAARNAGAPDPAAEAAQEAAQKSAEAANESRQAAEEAKAKVQSALSEAERLEEQNEEAQEQSREALADAAEAQEEIGEQASEGAQSLDRAGRHEQRLGNQEKSEAMQQAAQGARQAGQEQVPAAAQAAQQAQQPSDAAKPVADAREALDNQAEAARNASATPDESAPPAASDRTATMMAQALDRLDRAMNGGQSAQRSQAQNAQGQGEQGQRPSNTPGQQPGAQAARALAQQAAQAQARDMRNRRLPAMPSQPNGSGMASGADLEGMFEEQVMGERPEGAGDWGRLPPEVVKDLMQGQRDVAPAEYRDLVEAYYRAIAERAKKRP